MSRRGLAWRLALPLLLVGACSLRPAALRPQKPLALTPREALAPAPTSSLGGDRLRLAIAQETLPNGLTTVYTPPRRTGGLATVYLGTRTPPADDGSGGSLVIDAIRYALAKQLADFAPASLDVGWKTSRDGLRLVVQVPSEDVPSAIASLDALVRTAPIRESDVTAFRRWWEEELDSRHQSFEHIPDERLHGLLYADGDARRISDEHALAICRALDPATIAVARQALLDPSRWVVVVTGEYVRARVHEQIGTTFGAWPTVAPAATEGSPAAARYRDEGVRAVGLDHAMTRTRVALVERAPSLGHEDHATFLVIEQLLGGMFGSHANLSVREASAGSYGVQTSYEASCDVGELRIRSFVAPTMSPGALELLIAELSRVAGAGRGLQEAEFRRAQTLAYERLAYSLDDSRALATTLGERVRCGRAPLGVIADLETLDALTIERVGEVARRWIRPTRAPVVVIGSAWELAFIERDLGRGAMRMEPWPNVRRR